MTKHAIIIIGASSGIAKAFIKEQSQRFPDAEIITISRHRDTPHPAADLHYCCDYSSAGIADTADKIITGDYSVSSITVFNGILHNDDIGMPEKRLEDLNLEYSRSLFDTNTLLPIQWLQALLPVMKSKQTCTFTALSARVGSISDNRLGGWYSYRASKAALNMMFKSAAVELARRAKNVKLLLFHPGTTDTQLSEPFQANVPEDKLFSPEFVAQQLSDIQSQLSPDGSASYLDWQGQSISW